MQIAEFQFVEKEQMQSVLHDVGNMLHGITGYVELAAMRLENDPEKVGEALQRAMAAGAQAINFFHIMSRNLTASEPSPETFVAEIVEETVDFWGRIFSPGIEIRKNIEKDRCPVGACPATVCQVAMNLIINAFQAMGDSGVLSVRVDTVAFGTSYVCLNNCLPPGRYSRIVVEDTGCGIPPEKLGKIFDSGFTTKSLGRGIGLAMVKKNLQRCGGGIRVRSTPGKGTRFEVFFPCLH